MNHKGLLPYDYYLAEKMGVGFTVPRGVRDKMWGLVARRPTHVTISGSTTPEHNVTNAKITWAADKSFTYDIGQ